MTTRDMQSPNWNERPRGVTIDAIVLHADSAGSASRQSGSASFMFRSPTAPPTPD